MKVVRDQKLVDREKKVFYSLTPNYYLLTTCMR